MKLKKELLGGADVIVEKVGYEFCVEAFSDGYKIKTEEQETSKPCIMTYTHKSVLDKNSNC